MTFLARYAAAASWKAGVPSLSAAYVNWAQNLAGYSIFPSPDSASSPLTFSITSGALPTGLTLDTATGEVHGTPTALGTYNFNLHLVDNRGLTADYPGTIVIGTLWTPANLTIAPKFWYDHLSTVTNVSGAASQWNDRSASAIHVTQGTAANRPTINASDAGVGGVRTLTFDGTNDRLVNDSATAKALYKNIATGWLMSVHRANTGIGTAALAIYVPNNSAPTRAGLAITNASGQTVLATSGRRADSDATQGCTSPTQYPLDTWVMQMGRLNYAAQEASLRVNGTQVASASGIWSAGAATSNTDSVSNALTLGTNNVAAGSFAKMTQAMAIGGSGASLPTETEVDKLFGWAALVFSLRALLPSDHPYKSVPPLV